MNVIITGGARGIGRATALACAREGAIVGINYHNSVQEAENLCQEYPNSFRSLRFDVTNPLEVREAIAGIVQREGAINILVNNAGVLLPDLLIKAKDVDVQQQIAVNLLGPILCTRAVLPNMMRRKQGLIINIGSISSSRPLAGQSVYSATKGALEAFTRSIAVEYGSRGIRCVAVRPGPVDTDLLRPLPASQREQLIQMSMTGRIAKPEEIAEIVVWLMSESAAFINGSVIDIDGGFSLG